MQSNPVVQGDGGKSVAQAMQADPSLDTSFAGQTLNRPERV
ncbi:hypothetical protein AB0N24_27475 [Arthrobacter sp. NPDC093128]